MSTISTSRVEAGPTARRQISLFGALGRHGPAALTYLLIALLFTYPTVFRLTQGIGGTNDALENYWSLWWLRHSLMRWHNPLIADWMFYPVGLPLYFHTLNPLNGLLSLPFQALFGIAGAYNLMNLLWFTFAAITAYALGYYLTRQRGAAFVAGLIYGFCPYAAYHLHVGQVPSLSLGTLPLYTLMLLRGLRERWVFLIWAAVVLFLIGLSDYHYLAFAVSLTAVIGMFEMLRLRSLRAALTIFLQCVLVGGIFALLYAPILVPMIGELVNSPYATRPIAHSVVHSADLYAFFLPSILHPLWGEWASAIFYDRLVREFITGGIATLGYVALTLAAVALLRCWRNRNVPPGSVQLFLTIFLIYCTLSLGPYLQVNGVNSFDEGRPIPLPYLLFRELPFMEVNRLPSRFVVLSMLALSALAAIGVAYIMRSPPVAAWQPTRRSTLLGLCAFLVLFEFWPRPFRMFPTTPDQVSPFYHQIAGDGGDYVLLEVPYRGRVSLFYQTYHGKRTLDGRISRPKPHPWNEERFFGPLMQDVAPWPEIALDNSDRAWRGAMACQNVRYVVFYKQELSAQEQAAAEALEAAMFPGVLPLYEDATLRAYGPLTDRPFEPYWTPVWDDWHAPELSPAGTPFRWLGGEQGRMLLYPCGFREASMRFNAFSFGSPRTLEASLNGQVVGSFEVGANELRAIELPLELQEGENVLLLRSVQPALSPAQLGLDAGDTRPLSFHISSVAVTPRRIKKPHNIVELFETYWRTRRDSNPRPRP